jgi:phage terminase large subunit
MYLYREIYKTKTLVEDHAREIVRLSEGETFEATVADWDAEDRATLERHGVSTLPAIKSIQSGIQEVVSRLQDAGDGKRRLYLFPDALVERDEQLEEAKFPVCTQEEFDAFLWPKGSDGKMIKELPVDKDNHGADGMRYAAMYARENDQTIPDRVDTSHLAWIKRRF